MVKALNPSSYTVITALSQHYSIVPYQSTHNTGGAIMGTDPHQERGSTPTCKCGIVRTCSRWVRARFPQNAGYNPDRHGRRARLSHGACGNAALRQEPGSANLTTAVPNTTRSRGTDAVELRAGAFEQRHPTRAEDRKRIRSRKLAGHTVPRTLVPRRVLRRTCRTADRRRSACRRNSGRCRPR